MGRSRSGLKGHSVAVHITFPQELLRQVDAQAEREQRTRSELFREALRHYLEVQRRKALAAQRHRQLLRALEESAGRWQDEGSRDPHRLREALWQEDQKRLERHERREGA